MRTMSRYSEKFAARLPAKLKRKLKREARLRVLDQSDILREALAHYFQRLESKNEQERA